MTIPMCWKCADSKTEIAPDDDLGVRFIVKEGEALHLVGCKAEDRIKNYEDAQILCPLLSRNLNESEP
jgi:hypothetical protein